MCDYFFPFVPVVCVGVLSLTFPTINQHPFLKGFSGVPRFGHTAVITDIYGPGGSLDTDELNDYIRGTIFVSGFCLALLLVWMLALIILKIRGKRVGIFAGYPLEGRSSASRIIVLVSAVIITCSGVMFIIRGANSVGSAFYDITSGRIVRTVYDCKVCSFR